MAEPATPSGMPDGAQRQAPKPKPTQNPAFRMMGMPNFKFKLPSRNWMIFLSITGSWAAAVTYDRRQKKANQQKWCDLVAHIAQEPLPVNQMPRKLTVFISAPPGDGIRPTREYFKEYVKPVLVAAAMDYDVIEGRKEGDVRYGTAEQVRRFRRKKGEKGNMEKELEPDAEQAVDLIRDKAGIRPEPSIRGDLVVGRHTWKEYIRGLHEGWLGPLDEPAPPPPAPEPIPETSLDIIPSTDSVPSQALTDDASPTAPTTSTDSPPHTEPPPPPEQEKKKKEEKKPPHPPPAYIPTSAYSSSPLTSAIPQVLEPSSAIPQPHLLGFLKTPIRIYNYLNQRHLADQIGRDVAAIVLAANRPYSTSESFATSPSTADSRDSQESHNASLATRAPENDSTPNDTPDVIQTSQKWEQQSLLEHEEPTWHKSVRKPLKDDPDKERVWLDDIVMDSRIAERMRKFELEPGEEKRAERVGRGEEKGRAREVGDLRGEKVKVGRVDEEDG